MLDAEGCVVAPGLVDIQVHFREPGREEAETIESGARAAALGGCTAVVCMPNTEPPLDDAAVVQSVLERGRGAACDVRVAGCITKGRRGEELAPMGELYDLGVRVFTDDGDCVADAQVMRRRVRVRIARCPARCSRNTPRIPRSSRGGHMHEGAWSARLGIPGRPAEAESSIVARDLALARLTGGRYHVLHVSSAQTRRARARREGRGRARHRRVHAATPRAHRRGVRRLRSGVQDEPAAARASATSTRCAPALVDGTIDAIATDHAPHAPETKDVPFEEAPPGMLGVETALAVVLTTLVEPGVAHARAGARRAVVATGPHRRASTRSGHGGPIAAGRRREPLRDRSRRAWVVDAHRLASRSVNSPWDGWKLTGKVRHTVLAGTPDRPRRGASMDVHDGSLRWTGETL